MPSTATADATLEWLPRSACSECIHREDGTRLPEPVEQQPLERGYWPCLRCRFRAPEPRRVSIRVARSPPPSSIASSIAHAAIAAGFGAKGADRRQGGGQHALDLLASVAC
jgi:hypothetical protein